jgi:hypothetical protein
LAELLRLDSSLAANRIDAEFPEQAAASLYWLVTNRSFLRTAQLLRHQHLLYNFR